MNLAKRIRDLRYSKGWGPDELANRAKISRTALYQIERGNTSKPQAGTLRRISRALGVPLEILLDSTPVLSESHGVFRGDVGAKLAVPRDDEPEQRPPVRSRGGSGGEVPDAPGISPGRWDRPDRRGVVPAPSDHPPSGRVSRKPAADMFLLWISRCPGGDEGDRGSRRRSEHGDRATAPLRRTPKLSGWRSIRSLV